MRAIEQALRQAADPRPGTELLDAGCGIGLETARLAAEYPDSVVTGLDRNVELLVIARRRADPQLTNLRWLQGDLAALSCPTPRLTPSGQNECSCTCPTIRSSPLSTI